MQKCFLKTYTFAQRNNITAKQWRMMKTIVKNMWDVVMEHEHNPLKYW